MGFKFSPGCRCCQKPKKCCCSTDTLGMKVKMTVSGIANWYPSFPPDGPTPVMGVNYIDDSTALNGTHVFTMGPCVTEDYFGYPMCKSESQEIWLAYVDLQVWIRHFETRQWYLHDHVSTGFVAKATIWRVPILGDWHLEVEIQGKNPNSGAYWVYLGLKIADEDNVLEPFDCRGYSKQVGPWFTYNDWDWWDARNSSVTLSIQ